MVTPKRMLKLYNDDWRLMDDLLFFFARMRMRCPSKVRPQQKCPYHAPLLKAVVTHNLMH